MSDLARWSGKTKFRIFKQIDYKVDYSISNYNIFFLKNLSTINIGDASLCDHSFQVTSGLKGILRPYRYFRYKELLKIFILFHKSWNVFFSLNKLNILLIKYLILFKKMLQNLFLIKINSVINCQSDNLLQNLSDWQFITPKKIVFYQYIYIYLKYKNQLKKWKQNNNMFLNTNVFKIKSKIVWNNIYYRSHGFFKMFLKKFRRRKFKGYIRSGSFGAKNLCMKLGVRFRTRISAKFPKPFSKSHFKTSVELFKHFYRRILFIFSNSIVFIILYIIVNFLNEPIYKFIVLFVKF